MTQESGPAATQAPDHSAIRADLERMHKDYHELLGSLSPEDWRRTSANAGWRVGQLMWHVAWGAGYSPQSVEECATREAHEETGVNVRVLDLVGVYSKPGPHGPGIVSIVYHGRVAGGRVTPGREALEARWFDPRDIPWDELAYETTRWALSDWLESRSSGRP